MTTKDKVRFYTESVLIVAIGIGTSWGVLAVFYYASLAGATR